MKLVIGMAFVVSATVQAGELVNWHSSGYVIPAFVNAGILSVDPNVPESTEWDLARSSCKATVYRASEDEEKQDGYDPKKLAVNNVLSCDLVDKNGETTLLKINGFAVRPWGNRFDKEPFQFLNDENSLKLFSALYALAQKDQDGPYSSYQVVGPDGSMALGAAVDVNTTDRYAPAYLVCSKDLVPDAETKSYKVYTSRCVFMFPKVQE